MKRKPKPTQYREITVGLTPAQYAYLRDEATARTTSIAQLVREMLHEQLPAYVATLPLKGKP